jgi:hypothetical protein
MRFALSPHGQGDHASPLRPWKANDPSKALSIVSHGQGEHVSPLRPWKANEVSEALCIVSWSGGTRPPMSIAKTMAGFSLD